VEVTRLAVAKNWHQPHLSRKYHLEVWINQTFQGIKNDWNRIELRRRASKIYPYHLRRTTNARLSHILRQRAFKKRKDQHVEDLKVKIVATEAVHDQLNLENARLRQELQQATIENTLLHGSTTAITPYKPDQATLYLKSGHGSIDNENQPAAIKPVMNVNGTPDAEVDFDEINIWRGVIGRGIIQGELGGPTIVPQPAAAQKPVEHGTIIKKRKASVKVACNTCRARKAAVSSLPTSTN
jgi:hypothetical protein